MAVRRAAGAGRHDLQRVPEPIGGYAALPSSTHNGPSNVQLVAAPDPYDQRRRVRALARIDLLDRLRREGRIDEASYLAGRQVEYVFETMNHMPGGVWFEGDRIDGSTSAELKAVLGVERAWAVNNFLTWLVRTLGKTDTRLLWTVLGNRLTFALAAVALWPDKPGVRGLRYTIDRFRDSLATLADARAARGKAKAR